MDLENDEAEQGVLSYGEFVRRETLMAWVERKRAYERGDNLGDLRRRSQAARAAERGATDRA